MPVTYDLLENLLWNDYSLSDLLLDKDRKLYIGFTKNLKKRLKQHKNGKVKSTRNRRPLRLIFYEAYLNKFDALRRERYFKTTKGKITLRQMLKNFFEE